MSFEDDEVAISMEWTEVYCHLLMHESILATPPEEVTCVMRILDLLTSMKLDDDVNTFREEKNIAIDCLLSESSLDKVKCLAKPVWFHCYLMVENRVVKNPDKIIVEINRQGFTMVRCSLHEFFLTGIEFSCYVCFISCNVKHATPKGCGHSAGKFGVL